MAVYRFRITFEDYEEIFREIDIKSDQTFEELHDAIQLAINFDGAAPASFYMSNDNWVKGQEISLKERPPRNGVKCVLMEKACLQDWIEDPHQKIYYESDYNSDWKFFVELVKILPDGNRHKKYPECVKVSGDAPKQHGVVIPYKDETDPEEGIVPVFLDDYVEEAEETKEEGDEVEEVIDPDEADAITDEGLTEEGPAEEEI
ncbi:MAG: hypothetical protein ABI855_16175 [Bacteroidota bacterium]